MYAILLPVNRVTRCLNCGQCMCGDWRISILVSFFAFAIKGNEKRNRKRKEKGSKYD